MFKVHMAMTQNVITVQPQTPIFDAIEILVRENITGLPVVSDQGELEGIISEKDMLHLLYNVHDHESTVGDHMTRDVQTFDKDDSLIDVCDCLINNNFRRIPILSDGKLVGVISRKDVIRFILSLRRKG